MTEIIQKFQINRIGFVRKGIEENLGGDVLHDLSEGNGDQQPVRDGDVQVVEVHSNAEEEESSDDEGSEQTLEQEDSAMKLSTFTDQR